MRGGQAKWPVRGVGDSSVIRGGGGRKKQESHESDQVNVRVAAENLCEGEDEAQKHAAQLRRFVWLSHSIVCETGGAGL